MALTRTAAVNVGENERRVSLIVGILLTLAGARRNWLGALTMGIGSALALRGLTGNCALYRQLGWSSARNRPGEPELETCIDRAVDDSFPASDPPAWPSGGHS